MNQKDKMIRLEKFSDNDFEKLISWIANEEELIQFAGSIFNFPLTKEQLDNYINIPEVNAYKVIYENIHIGHAEINFTVNNPPKLCRILIGDKNFRGRGLCQQIVIALLYVCKEKFSSHIVELNVFDWNGGAIRCYEKVGFRFNREKQKEVFVGDKKWISLNMRIEI
ncbi:MAG: GNAT family protein [Ignavibacteriaceae bacterium]|jgi:RimJ/RimL family protein N-acetyltransferase